MPAGQAWDRDELLLVLNLYHRLPFGRLHQSNPEVIALAHLIGRTPGAVALRLANFAHLDPSLARAGMSQVSEGARRVWDEWASDPESVSFESERLLAARGQPSLIEDAERPEMEGIDRDALVRARVNQAVFRRLILTRYDGRCAITGLNLPELNVAAHIVPWAEDKRSRLDPSNGLCLNALHDRAFERGLIVVDDSYTLRVAPLLRRDDPVVQDWLVRFDGTPLRFPSDSPPGMGYLRRHRSRFEWAASL